MKRPTLFWLVAGFLFGLLLYGSPVGANHPGTTHYSSTASRGAGWQVSPAVRAVNMQYYFDGNNWRKNRTQNDLEFAMDKVSDSGSAGMNFGPFVGFDSSTNIPTPTGVSLAEINAMACVHSPLHTITVGTVEFSGIIPGADILGAGGFCQSTGGPPGTDKITRGLLMLDRRIDGDGSSTLWHGGYVTPVPPGLHDARSVMVHELFHITGWVGHFDAAMNGCNGSTPFSERQTMCPSLPPGVFYIRTPALHDNSVIYDAYN